MYDCNTVQVSSFHYHDKPHNTRRRKEEPTLQLVLLFPSSHWFKNNINSKDWIGRKIRTTLHCSSNWNHTETDSNWTDWLVGVSQVWLSDWPTSKLKWLVHWYVGTCPSKTSPVRGRLERPAYEMPTVHPITVQYSTRNSKGGVRVGSNPYSEKTKL